MKTIIFFRAEGFYPTEYPSDYSDWQAEADRNPGTLRIEDVHGHILWEAPQRFNDPHYRLHHPLHHRPYRVCSGSGAGCARDAMSLDHGILNVPLAKRGNIDAQIDRYKAGQARDERKASTEAFHHVREQKIRVRTLLANIGDHRIMALAKPLGSRAPKAARKALYQAALSNLPRWIAALERETFPPGGCAACWAPLGQCDHTDDEWLGAE